MSKTIKLIDLAKKLGVGVGSLSSTLEKRNLVESPNPNTRIDLSATEILLAEHARGQRDVAEAIRASLRPAEPKAETAKSEPKKEPAEATTASGVPEIHLKVVGSINKTKSEPKAETTPEPKKTAPAPKAEPKVEAKPEPKASAPAPKVEKPAEPKVEVKPEAEKPKAQPAPEVKAEPKVETKSEKPAPAVEPKSEPTPVAEAPAASTSEETFRASTPSAGIQFNVVGKIDLSTINDSTRPAKKSRAKDDKKKRERIKPNAVDVKAEGAKAANNNSGQQGGHGQQRKGGSATGNGQQRGGNNQNGRSGANPNDRQRGGNQRPGQNSNEPQQGRKAKRQKEQAAQQPAVVSDDEMQRQVKESLARLTSGKSAGRDKNARGAKYRKEKRNAQREAAEEARQLDELESRTLKLTEFVTVSDLASMMDVPVTQVIGTCMSLGLMVSINMRLDAETIDIVAEEFGFSTDFVSADVVESIGQTEEEDSDEALETRPPIVTVMGHVDHGKTSLLDRLRNTNVIAGEAGGITQHIGAYSLKLKSGKRITFLDTPGHEAFTAMRARGAKITDIAIIIVAADDDVMPQTKEAINHASAAGVPIVFAINKIDKPGANPDRIREQLAAMNYLVEEWGGKYQCQEISAKQGINIEELLEKVLLEAELLELKANPNRRAVGSVIESSLDKGRGYVATVMVQNGTLSTGDIVLSGTNFGKVKAMFNERNQRIETAGPSTPVLILGLDGAPGAGESFNVMDTEQEARSITSKREQLKREQDSRTKKGLTLDELARRRALGNFQELNVIIKGDVDGSVEALSDSLIRLSTEEIQVNVIHKGVGAISESDVVLASASSAIIIGFQVRPGQAAKRQADREGVEIRTYSIIYDTIEDIKSAMEGMLSPEIKENVVANLEVRETFKITKVGTVAGCIVLEGKIKRGNKIRLIRDGIVKYAGALGSLKRFKDDAKEVVMGQDCGLNIDGYNDIMVGDIIEAYEEIEIKKTLD